MAPLGDAVRLVDGQEGYGKPGEEVAEGGDMEPLGGHQEELGLTFQGSMEDLPGFFRRQGRVEEVGPEPGLPGPSHLVFHEGDEGAHHQNHPPQEEGWKLEAHALPPSGREDPQGVPPPQDSLHQRLLPGTEGRMPQVALEGRWKIPGRVAERVWVSGHLPG